MRKKKKRFRNIGIHAILIFLALIVLVPFAYILLISFGKDILDITGYGDTGFSIGNYERLFLILNIYTGLVTRLSYP
jgi:ABC-type glycerol-3-phosphate transport system permease component